MTNLLAADEKLVPPCLSISVCDFKFSFYQASPVLPFPAHFFSKTFRRMPSIFFVLIFLRTHPPLGQKQRDARLSGSHPKHQLCCWKGGIQRMRIIIIDGVKKLMVTFSFLLYPVSLCTFQVNRIDLMETRLRFSPPQLADIMLNKCIIHSLV